MYSKVSRWVQSLKTLTASLVVEGDNRIRLSLGLMYTSNEHFCSIYEVCRRNIPASGFALLRPQLESYIRGLWIYHCATDQQINKIYKGEEFPSKNSLLNDLQGIKEFENGLLKKKVDEIWSKLCDYTHGGGIQGAWHIGRHEIRSYYGKEQLDSLYVLSCNISFLNSIAMAKVCSSSDVVQKLTDSYKRIDIMN